MLNKILSKKIKSPLLLLGLFPFCHSRESGNPSFLSLRGVKQRSNLNHNGFSLIELMIAVTILAMAVFGIFHAYSVGFLGMADARDRTVATNYAREAMEDVKNMDFELVTNENLGTAESVGEKFTRVISVNTENSNLKKITTLVYWNNRNEKTINIETSIYINRTLFNPGEAVKIILYANPYYSVLPSVDETIDLIAVIKDANGNTQIYWSGENICFNITSGSELGSLPAGASDGVDTNDGIAQTIFTPSNYTIDGVVQQGDVVIEASVDLPNGCTVTDTITITVTLGVVRIELSADPYSIDANGTSTSTVTATLVNSSGGVPEVEAFNEITFIISGEGTFVDSGGSSTVLMTPSDNTAIIYVESIYNTPGVATVTASSEGLLGDTVNIITTGVATSISVSVNPDLIYIGDTDGARVTVEIQDVNGNPVEYTDPINLSISGGSGTFADNPVGPDTTPIAYSTLFHPTSSGTITITASGGSLTDGSVTIDVGETLIADTITIQAIPKNILAGGIDVSEITATVKDGSIVISNYNNPITFEIVSDTSNLQNAELYFNVGTHGGFGEPFTVTGEQYGSDGKVEVYLEPASDVGICTIEVITVNSLGTTIVKTIEVGFYSIEDRIELRVDRSKMLVNGDSCTVTAEVVDEFGNIVETYNEDITFTILVGWPKNVKFALTGTSSLTTTLTNGDIDIDLIAQKEAGTVTLKASSFTGMTDITGYLNIQVVTTLLELALVPNISYGDNQVSFDIEVQGTEISLEEMKVSWSDNIDSEFLNKIEIGGSEVYSNVTGVVSGTVVNTITTLPIGIYTINLYFDGFVVMSGKTFNILFNTDSGNYPVEISEPPI